MGDPILCRLGFHKWRNYGSEVEVFWQEPISHSRYGATLRTTGEIVYEGHECTRCGMKLRRKFVTNSDGTLSCVGWEPDTEKTDNE